MDRLNYKHEIMNYWKWNKALVDYYFTNNNETEIIIYVDNDILDKIGKKNNIGTHEDFYKSIIINNDQRFNIVDPYTRAIRTTDDNRKIKKNLLSFAQYLSEIFIQGQKFPFFNYVVLAIVSYDGGNNYTRCLDSQINRYLAKDNSNHNILELLFEKLHKTDKRFINRKLTQQRYVGLIKFQVVLNYQETRELEDLLYKYRIEINDDQGVDYLRLVNKLLPFVTTNCSLRNKLIKSLKKEDRLIATWIENKIRNFNPENYLRTNKDEIIQLTKIKAAFTYNSGKLFLLSDSRICEELTINNLRLPKTETDSINGYFLSRILDISNSIQFINYEISNENLSLKTISIKDVNFLQKHSGYYIQTLVPMPECETFVIVKNNQQIKTKWETWAENNTRGLTSISQENTKEIFGSEWQVYKVTNILDQYFKQKINDENEILELTGCRRMGGISPDGFKETYLINALPYYEVNIFNPQKDKFKVEVKRGNHTDKSFNWFLFGNNLILKLTDFNLQISDTELIEVVIKYNNTLLINECFSITTVRTKEMNNLFKYDKWGNSISDTFDGSYYFGNKVKSTEKVEIRYKHEIKHCINELNIEKFQIVNILSSLYFTSSGNLKKRKLENTIRYAGIVSNIDLSLYTKKIIWNLVSFGYLSSIYNEKGIVEYQINPPMFVKIGRSFENGGSQVYMLMGGFTQLFLQKLKCFCDKNNVRILFRPVSYLKEENYINNHSIYDFLPDAVFIDSRINLENFKQESKLYFEVEDEGMTDTLLRFSASISEFENTFLINGNKENSFNIELQPTQCDAFPRIRFSKSEKYPNTGMFQKWLELKSGEFYGRNFLNNTLMDLPSQWLDYFVRLKKDECVMLHETPTGETLHRHIYIPSNHYLPLLLKKALIQFNAGLPTYYNAFMLDNYIDDNVLYSKLLRYNVSHNRDRRSEITRILTGNSEYIDNKQVRVFHKGYYNWKIQLYCSTDDFVKKGWKRFLMIYDNEQLKAIASKDRIFIKDDNGRIEFSIEDQVYSKFKEINIVYESINKTLSAIIKGDFKPISENEYYQQRIKLENKYSIQPITIIN
jgi:hypothetical protein